MEFQKHINDYTILDGDKAIINKFNLENPGHKVKIVHTFFEDYEDDGEYDLIVASFVLEHVNDPLSILIKYKGYLSQNGKMYIAVPNAEALNRRIGFEAGILPDIGQLSDMDRQLGHKRYFTVHSITDMCENAGLKVTSTQGIYLKPFTTKQMLLLQLDDSIIHAMCKVGREYPELCLGILVECVK